MRRILLLLAACTVMFTGCSSAPKKEESAKEDADGEKVSTLPWNKPEKWEKTGNIGGGAGY